MGSSMNLCNDCENLRLDARAAHDSQRLNLIGVEYVHPVYGTHYVTARRFACRICKCQWIVRHPRPRHPDSATERWTMV
jgi:hypothetical protein